MLSTALTAQRRADALASMSDDKGLDVLVVGGGVTGAGIALDAATRGLRTGIVEARDWAAGTSSRSSRLVHGGLRYLYQLNVALVAEALGERDLLLRRIAPHLVRPLPLLWPLKVPVVERAYSTVGVGIYDALSFVTSRGRSVPGQRHYTRSGARRLMPAIREDALVGAIRFYDAQVDDARLVLAVVRTAVGYGALAAPRTQVVDLVKNGHGRVVGARLVDLEGGRTYEVRARRVINATGVWTEQTQALGGTGAGLQVLASKGVHILVPRERIRGELGLFLRTEKSVLFVLPWERGWVLGTTDTPWRLPPDHPVPTARDIDYILEHANAVLEEPLTRDDVVSSWAGLRPLLQPGTKGDGEEPTKISREHMVTEAAPGLVVIAGGKLTTYRVMARDAVDFALGPRAAAMPSITHTVPLVGAEGYGVAVRQRARIARRYGWSAERVEDLLHRYGAEIGTLLETIDDEPDLGRPLKAAPAYLRAEVRFAVTHEGALHLEDVLERRVRLDDEMRDRGVAAADEIIAIMARELGWDAARSDHELTTYRRRVEAMAAAAQAHSDEEAEAARRTAPDLVPLASGHD